MGNILASEKNRFQNSLTVSTIQLASVISDTFGNSAQKIISSILDESLGRNVELADLTHGRLKAKLPQLELAVDGFIQPDQVAKLRTIKQHYENLVVIRENVEREVLALSQSFKSELELLRTVPGLGSNDFTVLSIISEIGADMSQFPTAKHLCSWAGLTPTNNESAGKKKSVRISKAGQYIKPLLVQIANVIVRSDKHPEIKNRFNILKRRRGHKKTIIAITRQLLTAIYFMLHNHEPYQPKQFQNRPDRKMTVRAAVEFAKTRGFEIALQTHN